MILTFALIIGAIGAGLYWISNDAEKSKKERLSSVHRDYKYLKGVIVKMQAYKGHSIEVKYHIDNVEYKYNGGWDFNPKKIGAGDSIELKYAVDNPKLIITELEHAY